MRPASSYVCQLILAIIFLHTESALASGKWRCCDYIPNKEKFSGCKDACEQAFMSGGPLQELIAFSYVYRYCPTNNLMNFWQCINSNYQVLADVDVWPGRACCDLATTVECKLSCLGSVNKEQALESCVPEKEKSLVSCLDRQLGSAVCCGHAYSLQCKSSCWSMFAGEVDNNLKDNLDVACSQTNHGVIDCVANWTSSKPMTVNPSQSLKCCDLGSTNLCKQTCIQSLTSLSNQNDIIDNLKPVCNQPVTIEDPMWKCFLLSSQTSSNKNFLPPAQRQLSPTDAASIQCCSRAVTSQCRSLCIELYSQQVTSVWDTYSSSCQYNKIETELNTCIQDVEEPCRVGCQGLQFCRNFNYRATDMFRMCSVKADQAARNEYSSWLTDKVIKLPNSMRVPIKDISTCQPDMWKAIACALQIKPCQANSHVNRICKSDCISILGECIDDSNQQYNVSSLCDLMPVTDSEDCISLKPFTEPVQYNMNLGEISNPCIPNPCHDNQLCEVNEVFPECLSKDRSCLPYICNPGCHVGDTSPQMIKFNYHVVIADITSDSPLTCQKVCKCGQQGLLTHCKDPYCLPQDSCLIQRDSIVEHQKMFNTDCNQCICISGEVVCGNRFCAPNTGRLLSYSKPALPCNCAKNYSPVCTTNGRVLPNLCVAQCSGFSTGSLAMGNCAAVNPCGDNPCPAGFKCVPYHRVCLSTVGECPQYSCVSAECDYNELDPACDTTGVQHANVCSLLARRKQLAYRGKCITGCDFSTAVCGVDGETYKNECTALAENVAVDYFKPCSSVPTQRPDRLGSLCADVTCNRFIPEWCKPFVPPGACCPVCGAMLNTLYSKQLTDTMKEFIDTPYNITIREIAEHLHNILSSSSCGIFTYISYEEELIILVLPTSAKPTMQQVELCNIDAQRLNHMINTRSSGIITDAMLAVIVRSDIVTSVLMEADFRGSSSSSSASVGVSLVLTVFALVAGIT